MGNPLRLSPTYLPENNWAIPRYMQAEGLQNRAFVTKQQARGTYDNPDIGQGWDSGWAVPQYVLDEGYGQGAYVTAWKPDGYVDGTTARTGPRPPKPSAKVMARARALSPHLQPEHITKIPPAYQKYGHQAAAAILSKVNTLAPAAKKPALRRALDAIDKTLWSRVAKITAAHQKAGVPAVTALHHGIAQAMSQGLLHEIITTGKKGTKPPPKGQLGLGCYGVCGALGAIPAAAASGALASRPTAATTGVQGSPDGTCTADGTLIYVRGTWRVKSSVDTCTGTFAAQITAAYVRDVMKAPIYVGPFLVPWSAPTQTTLPPSVVLPDPTRAPAELAQLGQTLSKDWGDPHFSVTGYSAADVFQTVDSIANSWKDCPGSQKSYYAWMKAFGVPSGSYYYNMLPAPLSSDWIKAARASGLTRGAIKKMGYPIVPIGTFAHPIDGQKWGVFTALISGAGRISSNDIDTATSNNCPFTPNSGSLGSDVGAMQLQYFVVPLSYMKSWLQNRLQDSSTIASIMSGLSAIWNTITEIVNFVGDVAVGIVQAVGTLACGVLSGPDGMKGAAQAGAAAGGPAGAAAGAAGAAIAGAACGSPAPPPTVTGSSSFLPLAIAGGAVVVAVLLSSRRGRGKPKPPSSTAPKGP